MNYVFLGASLQIAIGLFALISWKIGYIHGITWGTSGAPIQFNAALMMVGLGLIMVRWSWIIAAAIVFLSAGALFETWLGTVALDQIFQTHYFTEKTVNPGRMAPNTSLLGLGQLIAALALIKRYLHTGLAVLTFVGLNASASAMAYFSTMTGLYHWDVSVTAMSLPAATAIAVGSMPLVIWYGRRE